MYATRRYFPNPYEDYTFGSDFEIPIEKWLGIIKSIVQMIMESVSTTRSRERGLYVGNAGIGYMLCHLIKFEPLALERASFLGVCRKIFEKEISGTANTKSKSDGVSFLCGPSGVYALGAFLGRVSNNETLVTECVKKFQSLSTECLKPNFLQCGSNELFVGRAGYLCGMLAIEKMLQSKVDLFQNDLTFTLYILFIFLNIINVLSPLSI